MQIAIVSDAQSRQEFVQEGASLQEVLWFEKLEDVRQHESADVVIDLLFEKNEARIEQLRALLPRTIIVNSVEHSLESIDPSFIRINGWPTFLKGALIEASCLDDSKKSIVENVFQIFQKKVEWLPDEPGFVTPRVISMIINEAFLSLEEGVSSKEDINTAMRLGTNYPYGPFEWVEKIGPDKVRRLLHQLSLSNPRYTPSRFIAEKAV